MIGKIQTRFYENQEGKRVYVTEVIADSIQFIDTKPNKSSTAALTPVTTPASTPETSSTPTSNTDSEKLEEKIFK